MKRSRWPIVIITLLLIAVVMSLTYIAFNRSPSEYIPFAAPDPVAGAVKWYLNADDSLIYEADTNEGAAPFGRLAENALTIVENNSPENRNGGPGFFVTTLLIGYGLDGEKEYDLLLSRSFNEVYIREKNKTEEWRYVNDDDFAEAVKLADFSRFPFEPSPIARSIVMKLEDVPRNLYLSGYDIQLSYPGGSITYSKPLEDPQANFICVRTEISLGHESNVDALTICFGKDGEQLEFAAEPGETVEYELENGVYDVLVTIGPDWHAYYYRFTLEVARPPEPDPELALSAAELAQGQAAAVRLSHVPEGEYWLVPLMSQYDNIPMYRLPGGAYMAVLPVPVTVGIGSFDVAVVSAAGETVASAPLKIIPYNFERQDLTVSDSLGSVLSNENQRKDDEKMAGIYDHPLALPQWQGLFIVPCEGGVTTKFAQQRYINGAFASTHSGVDIGAAQGTEVKAAAAGRVIFADELIISGNTVIIDHGAGVYTSYLHLSEINVAVGEDIKQGKVVGLVGSTGFSTGPHLHWTLRVNGRIVDPFWMTENDISGLLF